MIKPGFITSQFAIAPQVAAEDFARLREAGFKSVINARPDSEIGEFMKSDEAAGHAAAAGLDYFYTPTESHAVFESEFIDRFEQAMIEMPAPILAHCKSGTRTAILWALVAVRHQPTEDVIGQLNSAGQELTFLEDELRAERDNAGRSPLRLKDEGLLSLGRSPLLRGRP